MKYLQCERAHLLAAWLPACVHVSVRARVSQLPRRVSDDDEEGGGFFYNEEEVLAGAGGDERAAILDRFDAMLQIPSTDGVEDVRLSPPARCVRKHTCATRATPWILVRTLSPSPAASLAPFPSPATPTTCDVVRSR